MKWEYKVVKVPVTGVLKPNVNPTAIEQVLNGFGNAGWELVSMVSIATENGATIEVVLSLKRATAEAMQVPSAPPPLPEHSG